MRTIILLLFSFLYLKSNAQNGKTYKALIGESCEKMTDGGCMIYDYQTLKFGKDSVEISNFIKASCIPKEKDKNYENTNNQPSKTYKWSVNNATIIIENYNEYGKFTIQDNKLIAEKNIEFIEVSN